jgi:threonine synthase
MGRFAKRVGLPAEKLVIGTNESDILDRFFKSGGHYTKEPIHSKAAAGQKMERRRTRRASRRHTVLPWISWSAATLSA